MELKTKGFNSAAEQKRALAVIKQAIDLCDTYEECDDIKFRFEDVLLRMADQAAKFSDSYSYVDEVLKLIEERKLFLEELSYGIES